MGLELTKTKTGDVNMWLKFYIFCAKCGVDSYINIMINVLDMMKSFIKLDFTTLKIQWMVLKSQLIKQTDTDDGEFI